MATVKVGDNTLHAIKDLLQMKTVSSADYSVLQYRNGDQVPGSPSNVAGVPFLSPHLPLQGAWR